MTPEDYLRRAFQDRQVAHLAIDVQRHYYRDAIRSGSLSHDFGLVRRLDAFAGKLRGSLENIWIYHAFEPKISDIREFPLPADEVRLNRKLAEFSTEAQTICGRKKPAADRTIAKSRLSAFDHETLEQDLKDRGIKALLLTGIYGDCCVQETAIDAAKALFHVFIVHDLTVWRRGFNQERWNNKSQFYNLHLIKSDAVTDAVP